MLVPIYGSLGLKQHDALYVHFIIALVMRAAANKPHLRLSPSMIPLFPYITSIIRRTEIIAHDKSDGITVNGES
jgi:hypothetical protein